MGAAKAAGAGAAARAGETGGAGGVDADRIHPLQRALAATAALLSLVAVALSRDFGLVPFFLAWSVPFVGVLLVRRRPAFRTYCLALGLPVLLLALPLALVGFLMLLPSAVLLLLARSADPRRDPDRARFHATLGVIVVVLFLARIASGG
ncbi:hypothetical protein [Streptomyces antimicrobicus]|uniref:Uncharacterized protein n=1 Tax=Streptomyces antimicrobicus TaxID=2883108 RepID=A0ABS8BEL9_9ACTN|nr:hypothetical protein [Streptomyces antimicrobicus]MCB5183081.1 hypothetical protein [Streptomyces antimicrobicus]